jgi:N-methylhydantoinase A
VPDAAGVLSALGLVTSDERRDRVETRLVPLADAGDLPSEGDADLRYRGQSFELTVPLGDSLAQRFHDAHRERYGYADPAREIELVALRTASVRPAPAFELRGGDRRVVRGPAVVELPGATCWVPAGWGGAVDRSGTMVLERA